MPNPEVKTEQPSAAEIIKQTADRLKRLQTEVDLKKAAQEIPSKEDLARYRKEIAELRATGVLESEQETVLKQFEEWFVTCEKMHEASTSGRLDGVQGQVKEWMKQGEAQLNMVKKFGTWMLKLIAGLFPENGVLRKFILSDKVAFSPEAEKAYLRSFPALEKADDATLSHLRDVLHAKAADIAASRGKPCDIEMLMNELTKGNKFAIASAAALEKDANQLADKERADAQKRAQVAAIAPAVTQAPPATTPASVTQPAPAVQPTTPVAPPVATAPAVQPSPPKA